MLRATATKSGPKSARRSQSRMLSSSSQMRSLTAFNCTPSASSCGDCGTAPSRRARSMLNSATTLFRLAASVNRSALISRMVILSINSPMATGVSTACVIGLPKILQERVAVQRLQLPHRNQLSGGNIDHGHVGDKLVATKSAYEIKLAPLIARIPVAWRPGTRLPQRFDNRSRQVVAHEEGVHAVGVGAEEGVALAAA